MVIDARYKSLFIFPAVGLSAILFGVSVFAALRDSVETMAWFGAAIASLPLPLIAAYLMFANVPRTSENLPFALLVSAAGVLVAGWEQFIELSSGWAPTAVALASALLLLLYVFWYSRFGRHAAAALAVGGKLPAFTLSDVDGNAFDSASLLGSPSVVLFYRGNWCPVCMAQVREMAERREDLEAMRMKVALVSPQPLEQSRKLATRYDVPYLFLVDEGNRVAESLGIAIRNGVPVGMPGGYAADTVLPTMVVCNESGTILFSDQTDNYRVRPEPELFLAILRRAGVQGQ